MDTPNIAWSAPHTDEPAHVQRWREAAREQLLGAGLPDDREEHWRRANFGFVAALASGVETTSPEAALPQEMLA